MNPLRANFAELYQRHLCRHSQFGINVIHLVAVIGTYWALYGCALSLIGSIWPLLGLAAAYLCILLCNIPMRLFFLTLVVMGLFFTLLVMLPTLPFWVYLLTIYTLYKVQDWSHRIYDRAYDMTEFNQKYPKGFALFILLSTYELPIQLNALVLDSRDLVSPVPTQHVLGTVREPEGVVSAR